MSPGIIQQYISHVCVFQQRTGADGSHIGSEELSRRTQWTLKVSFELYYLYLYLDVIRLFAIVKTFHSVRYFWFASQFCASGA